MKIGVIGTGSMGTILLESFIDARVYRDHDFMMTNRSIEKAYDLSEKLPMIEVVESSTNLVQHCDLIFICVKPLQFPNLLRDLKDHLNSDQIVISITSPITVSQLEEMIPSKVARTIPSILNRAMTGPSLLSFGERCKEADRAFIHELMSTISKPLVIDEAITRVSSDIVSCGPAFMSYLLQQFIDGATRQTQISKEDATTLTTNMIIGLGKLLEKGFYTLPTLQERVCVPGGITGEGIKVLEQEVDYMFDHLFQQTHAKYYEDQELISNSMNEHTRKR
ncbi:late competence protein ComER [Halalkalibacter sp. APA_J-10(15)]|uniref:late competence protein ComER n=1 Tax=unclassified Halalkalibacter TaxID=2893063 RepID=UPI001FF6F804|nr:late competence protein ComER [Halalkalibacter sp. APA_J-10(15)]MCK0471620.1 late competence protein ComER [Halalkalibacter sp. APA_J-10(15)]